MPTLYVQAEATLRLDQGQLVALTAERELTRLPIDLVDLVVLQGPVRVTPGCLEGCLERGIPLAHLGATGRYLGRTEAPTLEVAHLQRAQLRASEDPERRLEIARTLVHAKLHNARICLHRWHLDTPALLDSLLEQERSLATASDLDELRGHEGVAAALYFRAIAASLDPAWAFTARQAHPPVGPFNAVLSFGYTLLYNLVLGAIRGAGLIAHVGFFHADREGHATLASDLVEEWRAVMVDRTVLAMIRAGHLSPEDFHETSEGTRLSDPARRLFLDRWERKLDEAVTLPGMAAPTPYRLALMSQVGHLARHLRFPGVPYLPHLAA